MAKKNGNETGFTNSGPCSILRRLNKLNSLTLTVIRKVLPGGSAEFNNNLESFYL